VRLISHLLFLEGKMMTIKEVIAKLSSIGISSKVIDESNCRIIGGIIQDPTMDSTTSISYSKNHWRTTRRGRTIADWLFFLPYPKRAVGWASAHEQTQAKQ
jgi:hypothetical protein